MNDDNNEHARTPILGTAARRPRNSPRAATQISGRSQLLAPKPQPRMPSQSQSAGTSTTGGHAGRRSAARAAIATTRTPAVRTSLAVSPDVTRGEVANQSNLTALPLSPAAWSVEALRIDLAAVNRKRRLGFLCRILVFVVLPTLLSAAYVYFYATPRYVSEFQITYQSVSPQSTSSSSSLLGTLLGSGSGTGTVDMSTVLSSYLVSDAILRSIDKKLDVRGHYSNLRIDWWDRLSSKASAEDFLKYFNRRVNVDNMLGGYVVVDVQAFSPKFAFAMAKAMAAACDDMVENLTARARQEEVRVAEAELKKTQARLVKATLAITNFRNEHVDFNPSAMAGQIDSVVGSLESQLAQARATLTSDKTFLSEKAPQVVALRSQIAGLVNQIEAEKIRLAATDNTTADQRDRNTTTRSSVPYSKLVAEWTALELEQKFASDSYVSAKSAYDMAQVDAERKENFVESFVKPNLPQRATLPDPWVSIPTTFLLSLFGFAIGSLLIGSFRDKAGM